MLNFDAFEVLTFDCYGTLIDWETGLWDSLAPVFRAHQVSIAPEKALELYGEFEAAAEAGAYRDYKAVLRTALDGIGARAGFTPTPAERDAFSPIGQGLARLSGFPRGAPDAQDEIPTGDHFEY